MLLFEMLLYLWSTVSEDSDIRFDFAVDENQGNFAVNDDISP